MDARVILENLLIRNHTQQCQDTHETEKQHRIFKEGLGPWLTIIPHVAHGNNIDIGKDCAANPRNSSGYSGNFHCNPVLLVNQ
jgi:hypothetical protein